MFTSGAHLQFNDLLAQKLCLAYKVFLTKESCSFLDKRELGLLTKENGRNKGTQKAKGVALVKRVTLNMKRTPYASGSQSSGAKEESQPHKWLRFATFQS